MVDRVHQRWLESLGRECARSSLYYNIVVTVSADFAHLSAQRIACADERRRPDLHVSTKQNGRAMERHRQEVTQQKF